MFIQVANLVQKGALRYNNKPEYLILHHAEMNGDVMAVNQVHIARGFVMIGYNYYVRKDGSIWRGRPEAATGANCYGYNDKSVSICAEGNFMVDTMSEVQEQAILVLAIYIEKEYGGKLIVKGHKECSPTDCPGTNYPLQDIKNKILLGRIDTMNIKDLQLFLNSLGVKNDIDGKALVIDGDEGA